MKHRGLLTAGDRAAARRLVNSLWGKKPLFVCVVGSTETAKIPGLSAAGRNPQLTDYTPAADVELLYYGRCLSIEGIPVTPEGIPTPAIITLASIRLSDTPLLVVSGGLKVKPKAPYIELGGEAGGDVRIGRAVENAEELFEKASLLGRSLSKLADYLVLGESIPGGTTTALTTLLALGVDARGLVSSSMPDNPHGLKSRVAEEALRSAGASLGSLRERPLEAVRRVGDPVLPTLAGMAVSALEQGAPVLLAGGTQMAAVLLLVKLLSGVRLEQLGVATTRWILEDKSSSLPKLVSTIAPETPILASPLSFTGVGVWGLEAYERGFVKEGVGAGGSSASAYMKSMGLLSFERIVSEVAELYMRLMREGRGF